MFRIVIAETDDSMRRRIVQALVVERGVEVVGTAPDPVAALDLACRTKPDLVLVDLGMPQSGGLLLIGALQLTLPDTAVVIRQAGCDDLTVIEAFRAGASGFLIEDGFDDDITSFIRLLTPAQIQELRPAEPPLRSSGCAGLPRARTRSRAKPPSRCDVPGTTGEPASARPGRRRSSRLGSCDRDNAALQPWRTGEHLSHHGHGHL